MLHRDPSKISFIKNKNEKEQQTLDVLLTIAGAQD
jgi:hypothetical protein